jgi:hypothetical protein
MSPYRQPLSGARLSECVEDDGGVSRPAYQASVPTKASLDVTSRVERKLAQYNASQNVVKRWLFEIISVGTSAVCMGKDVTLLTWACLSIVLTILRCNYHDTCVSPGSAT